MKNKKVKIVLCIILCITAVVVLTGSIMSYVDKPEDDRDARYVEKDKNASKQITYDNKTIDLKYFETRNREPTNIFGKVTSKYGANDIYTDTDGNEYGFLFNTDTLCWYFDSHKNIRPGSVVSSNHDAKNISDKFVYETLGFSKNEYIMSDCGYNGAYYGVAYTKYIAGIRTDDVIILSVYTGGEIASWSARNIGRCDDISVTAEQIKKCREDLNKEINKKTGADKWSAYDEYITTNEKGQAQLVILVKEMISTGDGNYAATGREYRKYLK